MCCSEYRNSNESRRIGSGRIPLRDSWDDNKYNNRGNGNDFPAKSSGETSSSSPTNSGSAATPTSTATAKTESSKPSDTSSTGMQMNFKSLSNEKCVI